MVAVALTTNACIGASAPRSSPGGRAETHTWRRLGGPGGYAIRALAMHAARLVVAADRLAPTPQSLVAEIDPDDGSLRVLATLPTVARVRALTVAADGWRVGGHTTSGRGAVLRSVDGSRWTAERLPPSVTDVEAINPRWAAARSDLDALLLERTAAGWRERVRVRLAAPARLTTVATRGHTIMAAGGDGRSAFVLRSDDGGRTFRRERAPDGMSLAQSLAFRDGRALLGGYAGRTEAVRRAVLFGEGEGRAWQPLRVDRLLTVEAIAALGDRLVVVGATGASDAALVGSGPGATWLDVPVGDPSVPATLGSALITRDRAFVAGASGVYVLDLPPSVLAHPSGESRR